MKVDLKVDFLLLRPGLGDRLGTLCWRPAPNGPRSRSSACLRHRHPHERRGDHGRRESGRAGTKRRRLILLLAMNIPPLSCLPGRPLLLTTDHHPRTRRPIHETDHIGCHHRFLVARMSQQYPGAPILSAYDSNHGNARLAGIGLGGLTVRHLAASSAACPGSPCVHVDDDVLAHHLGGLRWRSGQPTSDRTAANDPAQEVLGLLLVLGVAISIIGEDARVVVLAARPLGMCACRCPGTSACPSRLVGVGLLLGFE